MSISLILPMDRTLLGATTPSQSWPGNNGKELVLYIPQRFKTGVSTSDGFVSNPGHSSGGFYPSEETQSVYFMALEDWACVYSSEGLYSNSHTSKIRYKRMLQQYTRDSMNNSLYSFNSSRPVAIPRLKSPVWFTILVFTCSLANWSVFQDEQTTR